MSENEEAAFLEDLEVDAKVAGDVVGGDSKKPAPPPPKAEHLVVTLNEVFISS